MGWRFKGEQEIVLQKEDIEFNEYLTLFSLPSTPEPGKTKTQIDKGGFYLLLWIAGIIYIPFR